MHNYTIFHTDWCMQVDNVHVHIHRLPHRLVAAGGQQTMSCVIFFQAGKLGSSSRVFMSVYFWDLAYIWCVVLLETREPYWVESW